MPNQAKVQGMISTYEQLKKQANDLFAQAEALTASGDKKGAEKIQLQAWDLVFALRPYEKELKANGIPITQEEYDAQREGPAPTYSEWLAGQSDPYLNMMEDWRYSSDPMHAAVAKAMAEQKAMNDRLAKAQQDWIASGGEGVAPEVKAMEKERLMLEENSRALGLTPTHAYDKQVEENRALAGENYERGQGVIDTLNQQTGATKDKLTQRWEEQGPAGYYGEYEKKLLPRQEEMGSKEYQKEFQGNTIDNLNKLMSGVQDQSALSQGVNKQLTDATQGKLTAADSEWLKNSMAAREPYIQEMLQGVKEAAGKQRAFGSGRMNKQLADTSQKAYGDILAELSQLQSKQAQDATAFQTTKRGQDISLANLGAGMQGNTAQTQVGSLANANSYIRGMGDVDMQQQAMLHGLDKEVAGNQLNLDQNYLENMMNQLRFDDKEKDRTVETWVDPLDKIAEDVMNVNELANMEPGKKKTKLAKQAANKAKKLDIIKNGKRVPKVGFYGDSGFSFNPKGALIGTVLGGGPGAIGGAIGGGIGGYNNNKTGKKTGIKKQVKKPMRIW